MPLPSSKYGEYFQATCSGLITFTCQNEQGEDIECQGWVQYPCGAVHEPVISGLLDTGELDPTGSGVPLKQMPFRYQIWRERAKLAPCCHWRVEDETAPDISRLDYETVRSSDPEFFSFTHATYSGLGVEPLSLSVFNITKQEEQELSDPDPNLVGGWEHTAESGVVQFGLEPYSLVKIGSSAVSTRCVLAQAAKWNQGDDGTPPCNGAKTECPYYTGKQFQYIEDFHMAPGQPVAGEQVQEIRSLTAFFPAYSEPEKAFSEAFEPATIWARDFDDKPLVINEEEDVEKTEDTPPIINLTAVDWVAGAERAVTTKVPSEPGGTSLNGGTPDYPTFVDELGEANPPYLAITFPPLVFGDGLLRSKDPFQFDSYTSVQHTMYMAGIARSTTWIFVVNRTIIQDFPELSAEETLITNEEVDALINQYIIKSFSSTKFFGFKAILSGKDRFWQVKEGIDLYPNKVNQIYVLARAGKSWVVDTFKINYTFYHADIVQTDYTSSMPFPQTSSLTSSIASLTGGSVSFATKLVGTAASIERAYQVAIFDKSASRALKGDVEEDPSPESADMRFWDTVSYYGSQAFKGDGLRQYNTKVRGVEVEVPKGDVRWSRFDNCDRYLLEIIKPLWGAIPAGLDRQWEPREITLGGIAFKPVEDDDIVARSNDAAIMPSRFLVIEPKNDNDSIRAPTASGEIQVLYDFWKGYQDGQEFQVLDKFNGPVAGTFDGLYEKYPDPNWNKRFQGGVKVTPTVTGMKFSDSPHSNTIDASTITFGGINKYDCSYMIEFSAGNETARQWVLGVPEMVTFWTRDVDVMYAWGAYNSVRKFSPDYGRAISDLITNQTLPSSVFGPSDLGGGRVVYYPRCVDHEGTLFGPLFSPYDNCPDPPAVKINDLGIYVHYQIPGAAPLDEKYRGPLLQTVGTYRHNPVGTLTKCVFEFTLFTETRTSSTWDGYSRIRGPITEFFNPFLYALYQARGWRYPQFGNRGRDALRVYRTLFYRQYLYLSRAGLKVGVGWLPAVPFVSPATLYDPQNPRSVFDNTAQETDQTYDADYESFEGQSNLTKFWAKGFEDDDPEEIVAEDLEKETFLPYRYRFKDIYKIRKRRSADGKGMLFPPQGFYFNFAQPAIVWAFPEPEMELSRPDFTTGKPIDFFETPKITGVVIIKPKPEGVPTKPTDRYGRPIWFHLPELVDPYKLIIENEKWNPGTGELVEYSALYLNPEYKVYFNKQTGELYKGKNPEAIADEDYELYAQAEDPTFTISTKAFYPFDPLIDGDPTPDLTYDNFLITGELFHPDSTGVVQGKRYAVLGEDGQGVLDNNDEEFKWFLPALKIQSIITYFLPRTLGCVDPLSDEQFSEKLAPQIKYSVYPSPQKPIREQEANKYLSTEDERVLTCDDEYVTAQVDNHIEYRRESPVDPDNPDEGYAGEVDIELKLAYPVEMWSLALSYLMIGGSHEEEGGVTVADPPLIDPFFGVEVQNTETGFSQVLLEKPQFDLQKTYSDHTFRKSFKFQADFDSRTLKPMYIDRVFISIGKRDSGTTFFLGKIKLEHLKIRKVEEEIRVLEPRVNVSVGYSNGEATDLDHLWSQDPEFVDGLSTQLDTADYLEGAGIGDFWKAGAASADEPVISRGKIHRNWAGRFDSYDVSRYFKEEGAEIFLDGSVTDAEGRQGKLITEAVASVPDSVLGVELKQFFTPYNRYWRRLIQVDQDKLTGPGAGDIARFTVKKLDSLGVLVSSPGFAPGWQNFGAYACLDGGTTVINCVVNFGVVGVKHPHSAYAQERIQVCTERGSVDQFDLLDLPGFIDTPGLLGANTSVGGANISGQDRYNDFAETYGQYEQLRSIWKRQEIYTRKNRRYNQ